MSILSRLIAVLWKLPPARTYDLVADKDLRVPMRDGTILLADRHYPRQEPNAPTILIRSPYGRRGIWAMLYGYLFAERGFGVLIQSCRGTFGSGGIFDAFRNEQQDGQDTIEWIQKQPWFSGKLATNGASYLGFVQWATTTHGGSALKAMAVQISSSEFRTLFYPGESFGLDSSLTWIQNVAHQEEGFFRQLTTTAKRAKEMKTAAMHLPLREVDHILTGARVSYYQDWLEHNAPQDPWWEAIRYSDTVGDITTPINMVGGWYDIFLPHILADYKRLRQAGKQPYLSIGPWSHTSPPIFQHVTREALNWFSTHLLGEPGLLPESPVRVFVMGSNQWKNLPEWPPVGYEAQRWHFQLSHQLAPTVPTTSEPDRYRYDPADPTPAVGGSSLSNNTGPKDNREVEARQDVLIYTSAVLERDVEVIGEVAADLFVQSTLEHTDFFVRLCDVDPKGKSVNISDGLVRLRPGQPTIGEDGVWNVHVELWATAHLFKKGHRIRVQVAGGSHPRYARNTGTAEPLATATTLVATEHTIYHDAQHPSAIILPVKR
jgi:uncharacterized protein